MFAYFGLNPELGALMFELSKAGAVYTLHMIRGAHYSLVFCKQNHEQLTPGEQYRQHIRAGGFRK